MNYLHGFTEEEEKNLNEKIGMEINGRPLSHVIQDAVDAALLERKKHPLIWKLRSAYYRLSFYFNKLKREVSSLTGRSKQRLHLSPPNR